MKIEFNLKGAERKELVKAISRITGIKAEYQGMPTANFVIGEFTVTRDGALVYDDKVDAGDLLNELANPRKDRWQRAGNPGAEHPHH